MKKNKGVISVLLSVIILASVIAIGAAGDVCSLAVANSYAQRINYMACESVLAEYNANLFKDYGLMGFDGGKNEVKDRIEKYTSMMRRANEKSKDEIVFFDVILNDMSMDCSGKSLCEKTVFMEQIREIVKLKAVENGVEMLMDAISGKQSINDEVAKGKADYGSKEQTSEGNEETEISIGEKNYDPEENDKDRVLRSKRIIDSLPSNADADTDAYKNEKFDFGDEDELLKLGEGSSTFLDKFYSSLSGGTDKFILIDYAYEYFKNAVKSTTDKK